MAFAHGGKFKMLYDCRQRPQSVFLKDKLYIVYNGDAKPTRNGKGRAYPMLITYDSQDRSFSKPVRLGQKSSSDHHYSPIIWADENDSLHVLFGCHKTPGTHLISKHPVQKKTSKITWKKMPQIAPKLSYPTVYRIHGDKEMICYRTDGHTSSWTYRVTGDNGKTWQGPENDVTDLDSKGKLDWSSYQTKLPSKDGKHLHVVYTDYDDNKNLPNDQRFYNPRYDQLASNEWKYNLSYVKIDLETHVVRNAAGDILKTPICNSNHQWNSSYLARDKKGILHAYVIVGKGYLEGGYMDRHGGGRIEEWISQDKGNNWKKSRDLMDGQKEFVGWRYNNIQPVLRPNGSIVEGMLLFYGWKDEDAPEARAFLLHEEVAQSSPN